MPAPQMIARDPLTVTFNVYYRTPSRFRRWVRRWWPRRRDSFGHDGIIRCVCCGGELATDGFTYRTHHVYRSPLGVPLSACATHGLARVWWCMAWRCIGQAFARPYARATNEADPVPHIYSVDDN